MYSLFQKFLGLSISWTKSHFLWITNKSSFNSFLGNMSFVLLLFLRSFLLLVFSNLIIIVVVWLFLCLSHVGFVVLIGFLVLSFSVLKSFQPWLLQNCFFFLGLFSLWDSKYTKLVDLLLLHKSLNFFFPLQNFLSLL